MFRHYFDLIDYKMKMIQSKTLTYYSKKLLSKIIETYMRIKVLVYNVLSRMIHICSILLFAEHKYVLFIFGCNFCDHRALNP